MVAGWGGVGACGGERRTGDDAMQVGVEREVLSPGVRDSGEAEGAALVALKVARVPSKGRQGVGGGTKQKTVEDSRPVQCQGA